MRISAIAAMSEERVIGNKNQLPWHLPADLNYFKQLTVGKPILMGRKTYASIGRPLPNRQNIVITRDSSFNAPGCLVVNSIAEALAKANESEEIFIIGGAELFKQMLPHTQRLYLTIIHETFAGDTFFPPYNADEWIEIKKEPHEPDEKNSYHYTFLVLDRIETPKSE